MPPKDWRDCRSSGCFIIDEQLFLLKIRTKNSSEDFAQGKSHFHITLDKIKVQLPAGVFGSSCSLCVICWTVVLIPAALLLVRELQTEFFLDETQTAQGRNEEIHTNHFKQGSKQGV